jgi:hypothetical protein
LFGLKALVASGLTVVALTGTSLFSSSPVFAHPPSKVDVCHHTSSEKNPVVKINISHHAVEKHLALHGGTGPDEVLDEDDICQAGEDE